MINFSQLNLLEKYYYWKNIISEKYADTEYLSVFSPNAGKYGPEKTSYLDTFHTVVCTEKLKKK